MNVTWPFAQLWTAPERLTISAHFFGNYAFRPEQVEAVEPGALRLDTYSRVGHTDSALRS